METFHLLPYMLFASIRARIFFSPFHFIVIQWSSSRSPHGFSFFLITLHFFDILWFVNTSANEGVLCVYQQNTWNNFVGFKNFWTPFFFSLPIAFLICICFCLVWILMCNDKDVSSFGHPMFVMEPGNGLGSFGGVYLRN
jgi:hypothetical protein